MKKQETGNRQQGTGNRERGRTSYPLSTIFYLLFTILLTLLASGLAFAKDIEIEAGIDKTEATTDDQLLLRVAIKGTSNPPEPTLPPMDAFEVSPMGSVQKVEIVNFDYRASREYRYLLMPKRTGIFTIAPIEIKIRGRVYRSNPLRVTITSAPEKLTRPHGDLFLTASVDRAKVYVGQQIVYTFRFYRMVRVKGATYEPPDMSGFWTENLGKQRDFHQVLDNQEYMVTEVRQALFPTRPGTLGIGKASLSCQVVQEISSQSPFGRGFLDDEFFQSPFFGFSRTTLVPKTLYTEPIEVEVLPLPQDEPKDFVGLVGQFEASASLSKPALSMGESATLTLVIEGEGSLRELSQPNLQGLEETFKIYPDKPSLEVIERDDKIMSKKTFKYSIVPQKAGNLNLQAIKVPYFDPESKGYKVAQTPSLMLDVKPGEKEELLIVAKGQEQPEVLKEEVKVLGEDLQPQYGEHDALKQYSSSMNSGVFWLLSLLGPGLLYGGLFFLARHLNRLKSDYGYVRSKRALKMARKRLKEARGAIKMDEPVKASGAVYRALIEFLADRLNIPSAGLTPRDFETYLREQEVTEEHIRLALELMEQCDLARFASTPQRTSELEALVEKASRFLNLLARTSITPREL